MVTKPVAAQTAPALRVADPGDTSLSSRELVVQTLLSGPKGALGGGSIENQVTRLSDSRLPIRQRQALAAIIGRVQGNRQLQRVMVCLQENNRAQKYTSASFSPFSVSHPHDGHESEADRGAAQIMRMHDEEVPNNTPAVEGNNRSDRPQGQEDPSARVDRIASTRNSTPPSADHCDLYSGFGKLDGSGQPLSHAERLFFESRFRADFKAVRIHTDAQADYLARAVEARAFTFNNHIVFRSDEFQPGTQAGQSLLAHELTHTIQQGAAVQVSRHRDTRVASYSPFVDNISARRMDTQGMVQRAVTNLAVANATAEASVADHFVAPRNSGAITITATVSAAGQRVNWTGGNSQSGNNLQRVVPTGTARNVTITADTPADPGPQTLTIHVLDGRTAPPNTPAQLTFSRQPGNPPGLAPFGLTDIRTNDPVPRIRAFVVGNQWVFQVERISHRYLLGVTGGGNTDIRTAASATNANHCQVIADLTPPAPGTPSGPPRAAFWSQPITVAHENAHVSRFYSPPFWEAFMRTAEGTIEGAASNVNVDHTNAATLSETAVVAANLATHQATINAQHVAADAAEIAGAEVFAHGQSNPMYTTLVAQIAARFRPLAPSALVAVATGPTSVQLNWTHNACNDTEYRVYRRRASGAFVRIATLPAGSIAFTDTLAGLAGNTDFTYVITAAGVAGESNRSNQAAVHTP